MAFVKARHAIFPPRTGLKEHVTRQKKIDVKEGKSHRPILYKRPLTNVLAL